MTTTYYVGKDIAQQIVIDYTKHHKTIPVIADDYGVSRVYVKSLLSGDIPAYSGLVKEAGVQLEDSKDIDLNAFDFTTQAEAINQGYLTVQVLAKEVGVTAKALAQHLAERYSVGCTKVRGKVISASLIEEVVKGNLTAKAAAEKAGVSYSAVANRVQAYRLKLQEADKAESIKAQVMEFLQVAKEKRNTREYKVALSKLEKMLA